MYKFEANSRALGRHGYGCTILKVRGVSHVGAYEMGLDGNVELNQRHMCIIRMYAISVSYKNRP